MKLTVLLSLMLVGSSAVRSHAAAPDLTAWHTQAANTAGNVVADNTGWIFDGTEETGVLDFDYGTLDGSDVDDGATIEYICNISDAGASIALGSMKSVDDKILVLKFEQWQNSGTFGITEPGVKDHILVTPAPFGRQAHVVFVRNSDSTIDLYVNGEHAENTTTNFSFSLGGGIGNLGANQVGIDVPTGDIYGVATYDVALNATAISNLFATIPAVGQLPPEWQEDPIDGGNASIGRDYAGTLAGKATDPNGDVITYAKLDGPSWLIVATNGVLSGIPLIGDGTNDFVVSATDVAGSGISSNAVLQIVVIEPQGVWTGAAGDGEWTTAENWSDNAVPVVDGTTLEVEITGADVTYTPGDDLDFKGGSTLTLDGASLTQDSGTWTRYEHAGYFALRNGSLLSFENAKTEIKGRGHGSTFTIDNSAWITKELLVDDHKSFMLSNGATVSVMEKMTIQNGTFFDVTDSTLNLRNVALQMYAGNSTFIHVNNGAQVNLLNTTSEGSEVITKQGDSMVNFALNSSGVVFIDNISLNEVETMIGEEKFGIDGSIITAVSNYVITVSGAGQLISMTAPPSGEIGLIEIALDGSGVIITWDSVAGQDYDIQSKSNLGIQVDWLTIDSVVGSGSSISVTTDVDQAKSFYRVVSP